MNDTSLTIERMLAPRCELENLQEFQRQLDKIQRVEWIQSMGPWEVMMTGTFRWEASMESCIVVAGSAVPLGSVVWRRRR